MKSMLIRLLLPVVLATATSSSQGSTAEVGSTARSIGSPRTLLSIGPTSTPPVLDGVLDDTCWQRTATVSGFLALSGEWAKQQTTVLLAYDKEFLYVACRLNEPLLENLVVHTEQNDQEVLFNDDRMEIFLDTNHDGVSYYHLLVNSKGAHYDEHCRIEEGQISRDVKWNPDLEVKTRADEGFWAIETRIAFAALGDAVPEKGHRWGVNFFRERRTVDLTEGSNLAMTGDGVNRPQEFGDLIFGKNTDLSYSVVSIGNRLDNYTLVANLRNLSDIPIPISATWSIESPQMETATAKVTEQLAARSEKRIRFCPGIAGQKPSWTPRTAIRDLVKATLEISNTETKAVYESREGNIESPLDMDVSLSRFYYTPETAEAQITLTQRSSHADRFEVELRGSLRQGPLWSRTIPCRHGKPDYAMSLDLTKFEWGRYVVSTHLVDAEGKRLSTMDRVFFKMPAGDSRTKLQSAGNTSKAAVRSDGILLLNGKPFFPFSASPPVEVSPLATNSFNTHYWPQEEPTGMETPGAVAFQRVGMPWITRDPERGIATLFPPEVELLRTVGATIERGKADPRLYCWHVQYEAQFPVYRDTTPWTRLNTPEEYRKVSDHIKRIDPDHLTALQLQLLDNIDLMMPYRNSADVIELALPPSYARQMVPHFIGNMKRTRRLLGEGTPFVLWLGSTVPSPRYRTAEEIRCVSYLALLHGAAGIVFHMGHDGLDPTTMARHWSVYPGLYHEIQWVFEKLMTPQDVEAPRVLVSPAGIDHRIHQCNDRIYLVAVNTSPAFIEAQILFPDDNVSMEPVGVPLEHRTVQLERNGFKDTFTAFEPHVYELNYKKSPSRRKVRYRKMFFGG